MIRNSILGIGGSLAAVPTPFRNAELDSDSLARLCMRQLHAGTAAIVACGSTGEAATLSLAEYGHAIEVVSRVMDNAIPVIAGCTAPSTQAAIVLAERAKAAGADALLCAAPPYVKPTQAGIAAHIRAINHATDLPVVLYDVPGRSGVGIADETVALLYQKQLIVGIKDATADLARPTRLRRLCGDAFLQWSGDDATAPAYRAMGGTGCISVTANVTPRLCALLHRAWDNGDLQRFASLRDRLDPLHAALFTESNPIPLKAALSQLGLCTSDVRLPLTRATPATQELLIRTLAAVMPMEDRLEDASRLPIAS